MDELIFIGSLVLLAGLGLLLTRLIINRSTGRKKNHPVYQHEKSRRAPKPHARHPLIHSHTSQRLHAADDIWRHSRAKANESHWESGVIVANKILTDSELALERREPEHGHGARPPENVPGQVANSADSKRKSR